MKEIVVSDDRVYTWERGMELKIGGSIARFQFKNARDLQPGDRIKTRADGANEVSTVFSVGVTVDERGKPVKSQHMHTGNIQRAVYLIFEDGGEALMHPDERVPVVTV